MNNQIRKWHLIDAEGQILGRVAVVIAHLLNGKGKEGFTRNEDMGDYVVVTNALKIEVSGQKEHKKIYFHHTGYPQGLRSIKYSDLKAKDPKLIIIHAVKGMLPNNRLRALWLKRLYIYSGKDHPYQDKFKKEDK